MYHSVMAKETVGVSVKALKWAMVQKDWNAETLGKESGVNKSTISLLLNGKVPGVSAVFVAKMALALEVSTDFLMGLTSNPEPKPALDLVIAEIVVTAKTLSEFRQRDLLLMAKAYQETDDPTPEMLKRIFEKVEELAGTEIREKLAAAFAALHAPPRKTRQRPPSQKGDEEA